MGSDPTGAFGAVRRRPWVSLLGLLTLLSAALLLGLRSNIGFFLDDWALVIYREGGPSDWLLPHNEHIVVLPAAIYKLSLAVFGMTAMPLHVVAVALFLASVILLFLWLRPLVGEPASVLGCAVVLFLGAAVSDLIWAFQMGFFGSVAAGLGGLLMLRRGTGRGDAWACLLLVASILFSSLGIPLAIGAAVQLLFRQGSRPDPAELARRSWVFLVPAAVYVGWWIGWGHLAENSLSLHNAARLPLYALSSLGYAGAVLTGAFPLRELAANFLWALPGLVLAGALGYLLRRRRRVPPEFLVAAAVALAFWGLSGLNYIPGREFIASRYQYPGAIFLLMVVGGACAGLRPSPRLIRWMGALAVAAVTINAAALVYVFDDTFKPDARRDLAGLTAIDLASRTVEPDFTVGIGDDEQAKIDAGSYLAAVEKYGSPAWSESQIEDASETDRMRLDRTAAAAIQLRRFAAEQVRAERGRCQVLTADEGATDTAKIPSRLLYMRSENPTVMRLGRFAPGATAPAGLTAAGTPMGYLIPADRSDRPWRIGFRGKGRVIVCAARRTPYDLR